MKWLDFIALCVCCLIWGGKFVSSKWMLTDLALPLTLMTPFWAVILGLLIRGEPFNKQFVVGAAFILVSVYIIARRGKRTIEAI